MKKKLLTLTLSLALMTSFSAIAMANPAATAATTATTQVGQTFTLAGVTTTANTVLLAQQSTDINQDGVNDTLYLIGDKTEFGDYDNINLIAVDGKTNQVLNANVKDFGGTNAKISFVNDFNNDHAVDVLITAYSGGNNGSTNARIISFNNNTPSILLNSDLKINGERALFKTLEAVDVENDGVSELLGTRTVHGEATSKITGYEKVWFAYKNGAFEVVKQEQSKEEPAKQSTLGELTVGQPFVLQGVETTEKTVLLAQLTEADVNKDGVSDKIYLIGDKADETGYVANINLVVVDGKTNTVKNANIKDFAGYTPKLAFAGDFNGDKASDVMITAYSGGNSGTTDAYVVSFAGDTAKALLSVKPEIDGKRAFFSTLEPVDLSNAGDHVYGLLGKRTLRGNAEAIITGEQQTTFAFKDGAFKVIKNETIKADKQKPATTAPATKPAATTTPASATDTKYTVGKRFEMNGITTTDKTILIDTKTVDVTGNGAADTVYLIGHKDPANGGLVENLNIVVIDGKTKKVVNANLKDFSGFQPKIGAIGDFNKDKSKDVMVTVFSGGNNGSTNAYIVSFKDSGVKVLLNEYVKVNGQRSLYNKLQAVANKQGVYELVGTKTLHGSATSVITGEETTVLSYKNGEFQVRSKTTKEIKQTAPKAKAAPKAATKK